jgi:MFS superfamily sulfate permease-like transporter
MVTIVATDLLTGVLVGVGLSVVKLVYAFSHLRITVREEPAQQRVTMHLKGSATFLRLPRFAEALEGIPAQCVLHVNVDQLNYIDHACLELLQNWEQQHVQGGGRLVVDWDTLTARFRAPGGPAPVSVQRTPGS